MNLETKILKERIEPIIGLDFIEEVNEKDQIFKCNLCTILGNSDVIWHHLIGFKHRLETLKSRFHCDFEAHQILNLSIRLQRLEGKDLSLIKKRQIATLKFRNLDEFGSNMFQVKGTIVLPCEIKLMTVNDFGKMNMLTFLWQYLEVFDQDGRSPLIHAYHESALFSFNSSANGQGDVIQGNDKIIRYLQSFPATKHNLSSLSLDLPLSSPNFMFSVVTGTLRERTSNEFSPPEMHFQRVFVIIPQNNGFVIVNDSFRIINNM